MGVGGCGGVGEWRGGPYVREVTAANCCNSISESKYRVTPHYWKRKKGEVICVRPSHGHNKGMNRRW